MRTAILATLIGLLASIALAGVSAHVYRADEVTPLAWADPNIPDVYQEIMAGTRLTLFIGSDAPESLWSGGLWMSWEDWDRGTLAGRGYSEDTINFEDSILEAAGEDVHVIDNPSSQGMRFSLGINSGTPGEWFVLDYHAQAVGTCTIGLYSYALGDDTSGDFNPYIGELPPPAGARWLQGLTFNHVLSRDCSGDHIVNFVDFALLAGQWQGMVPADPNATACPDLNADEVVEIADLTLFCEYWLERTDIEEPEPEPNMPSTEP